MSLAWLVYLGLGAVAGVMAGLLGIGGGLILVAALVWLLPAQGVPAGLAVHMALATALASIVLTGLSSARAHHRRGSVLWPTVAWLVPGMLLGGWLGSLLATRLEDEWLRGFIAAYCYLAALQLGLDWPRAKQERPDAPKGAAYSASGVFVGAISALVGIGGGSMTVPLLVWRGVRPVRAVGTSSACGVAIALASAAGYAAHGPVNGDLPPGSWGYVFVPAAVAIALASVLTAPLGTRLAHRLSGEALRRVFAVFLVLVGTSLLWAGT
ncbi:sulfite exporter TauE/SafE family protein [Arenimonas terrae]|uniref:Probable membrane transporter protein n=1 Tax=Arenimonas terrae TaxID=2546226 RepID=A0A5C4RWX2_9GAMM|nr:sulfite exporter TauE/SafE family protein [Arenimonas terrae]TNJ35746.1 sulfite exporter TauE/SafE family protein [Arenimonas terrae]